MSELTISYFRNLLADNVDQLQILCNDWESVTTDSNVPEEVKDEVRTTIGLTKLLLRQKLKQFHGLIDDAEFNTGEKEIRCIDLQGFWDMVFSEVEKINNSFQKLKKSKENNWILEELPKLENKKKALPAIAKTKVVAIKHVSAARQRLAEAKLRMKQQMALKQEKEEMNTIAPCPETLTEKEEISAENVKTSESKIPINNITNVRISEPKEQIKTNSSKKVKNPRKATGSLEKENFSKVLSLESEENITPENKKKRENSKESIPLQCITRSAKKAMLLQQSAMKN